MIVRLTQQGIELVEEVAATHLATERRILAVLSPRQKQELAALLRVLLLELGDRAES